MNAGQLRVIGHLGFDGDLAMGGELDSGLGADDAHRRWRVLHCVGRNLAVGRQNDGAGVGLGFFAEVVEGPHAESALARAHLDRPDIAVVLDGAVNVLRVRRAAVARVVVVPDQLRPSQTRVVGDLGHDFQGLTLRGGAARSGGDDADRGRREILAGVRGLEAIGRARQIVQRLNGILSPAAAATPAR